MWLLEFLFFFITLIIGWTLFGYFIFIWFEGLFKNKKELITPISLPKISVIVPCYNEKEEILNKINNIRNLDYPRELIEIFLVDGGSDDGTVQIIESEAKKDNIFSLVKSRVGGKINQMNFVLPVLKGDIIVNTDVDSQLSPDALKNIVAEFETSEDVWVVGAYSRPRETLDIENYYWSSQNKGRFLESNVESSSIVIAQCYAFRKLLLSSFPEDVIADDVYIAFLANSLGKRVVYSTKALAVETRSPKSYSDFLPHKFRKSNAFLRESLRFIYRLPDMRSFSKMMIITRISQQLFLPWAILFWALMAGTLLTFFRYDVVIFAAVFLIILFILTTRVFSSVKLPDGPHRYSVVTLIKGNIVTIMIMFATGLSYPFFRQGSSYSRLTNKR